MFTIKLIIIIRHISKHDVKTINFNDKLFIKLINIINYKFVNYYT